jgi:outer membrane protein OmpA-like peptidoglycan-associated protein
MIKSTRLLGALLFGSVSFVAIAAHADEPEGFYVGGNGGLTKEEKLKTDLTPTNTGLASGQRTNSEIKNQDGWVGAAEVGYNWGNNIRTEIEGTFAENSARRVFGIGGSGRTDLAAGFVNVFYDFDLTQFNIALPIVPYVGVGAGGAYWGQQATFPQVNGGTTVRVAGNGFAFVYQAIAGLAYNIDDNWAVTGDIRYMDTPAADFGDNKPLYVTNHLHEEQALVGVRYTFSQPAPAPMPAPAPAPAPAPKTAVAPAAKNFLVFFDFNKYNLTMDAQKIVDNAAMAAKNGGVTQIDVTGHTDTVGSDAYNMKLSKRRAESVKAELVRQGVQASDIMIYAKGKRDPLVPTGDNVREPQNRRVEIVFH